MAMPGRRTPSAKVEAGEAVDKAVVATKVFIELLPTSVAPSVVAPELNAVCQAIPSCWFKLSLAVTIRASIAT